MLNTITAITTTTNNNNNNIAVIDLFQDKICPVINFR
jgi:hypothetical protein